jgi:hypothetical protein
MKPLAIIPLTCILIGGTAFGQTRQQAPRIGPIQVVSDSVEELRTGTSVLQGRPGIRPASFEFPAPIVVDPARGWLHGSGKDFLCASSQFEPTADPGTLRLAPESVDDFVYRDFESGLEGLYATGAFSAVHDTSVGYNSPSSARIDTQYVGGGSIYLASTFSTGDYPELEMRYKADPEFDGFTLIARVKSGAASFDVTLIDIRLDRLEDGSPPYDGEWRYLRIDLGGLLAAEGFAGRELKSLRIQDTASAIGACMWIDDLRVFGATYPEYADYFSPPHRLDQIKDFDTLYWARSRVYTCQPFEPYLEGDNGTGLEFQIRTAASRPLLASATWLGPTGPDDWYVSDGMVAGFAKINPAHNGDRWVQVRSRLVASADRKHTPVLEDFCVTWGGVNEWDVLMLLMRSIDADYEDSQGDPQHETYTMPQAYVDDVIDQWDFFMAYAARFFCYNMKFNWHLEVIEEPVTEEHLSGSGTGGYTIDPYAAQPLYDHLLGADGIWDSIMFHFRWEKVPFPAWGLAWWPNFLPGDAAMTQILYLGPQYHHHEVMLHEWMHTFAWTVEARTDSFIPHPHTDQDPHWDPTDMTSMDYYYHCLVWHGDRFTYDSVDLVDDITAGYQNHWLGLGYFTFDTSADDGLYIDYIGEDSINPWLLEEADGKWWDNLTSTDGYINLRMKYGTGNGRVAYADLYMWVAEDQTVKMWTGTDDGFRAWLNNLPVRDTHLHRSCGYADDSTALALGEGWNHLMLKVENMSGSWGFRARLAGYGGGTVPNLLTTHNPAGYTGFENVLGQVDLGVFADPTQARLRFEVADTVTGEVHCGRWVYPEADGSFKIGPAPRGEWLLRVRGTHWLTTSIPITIGMSDLEGVMVELVNGDANGDNLVDLLDIGRVLVDYGSYCSPYSNLDGSGQVDLGDLNIVLTNFGAVGS